MKSEYVLSRRMVSALLVAAASASPVHAALTATGIVTPTNLAGWTSQTTAYIGGNASGSITVDGGSTLSAKVAYLGNVTGITGSATIDGTASTFTVSSSLYVGNLGIGTLVITNGGRVSVAGTTYVAPNPGTSGTIDFGAAGGTLTTTSLWASPSRFTGTGTIYTNGLVSDTSLLLDAAHPLNQSLVWNSTAQNVTLALNLTPGTGDLGAGYLGNGSLAIADGLAITSASGYLGYKGGSAGTATVNGTATTWTITQNLYAGYSGSGTLALANGAKLLTNSTSSAYLGFNASSSGMLSVDGLGAAASIGKDLYVGYSGNGALALTNGAAVSVGGTTRLASNNGSSATLDFGAAGGTLTTTSLWASPSQVTGTGTINTTGLVTDGSLVFDATHGPSQTLLWNSAGQNVTVAMNLTSGTSDLGVGYIGNGSLTITEGRAITSSRGYLGYRAGSAGSATVSGSNSSWALTTIYVGYSGSGSLNINTSGKVSNSGVYLGYNASSNGMATINGAGSLWAIQQSLYVGNSGNGTLVITDGGSLTRSSGGSSYIAYSSNSTGSVIVNGTASAWTLATSPLYVGYSGAGTLGITNGGAVTSQGDTFVAYNTGSSGVIDFGAAGGTLTTKSLFASPSQVTGTGTVNALGLVTDGNVLFDAAHSPTQPISWNSTAQSVAINLNLSGTIGALGVGYGGTGSLAIRDGVMVNSNLGYLGYKTGSVGTASVDGTGSRWRFANAFYVGYSGNGQLTITNHGYVDGGSGYIAYAANTTGTMTVDGAGSTWSSGSLDVGYSGNGHLVVTNAGYVTAGESILGDRAGATGTAIVDGPGSGLSSVLYVGYFGNGTIAITNGGHVHAGGTSPNIYIGTFAGSTGTVTVDGAGSSCGPRKFYVGNSGNGTLAVTNGGNAACNDCLIGYAANSNGVATVDGPGSILSAVVGDLYVGFSGRGTLAITHGGNVTIPAQAPWVPGGNGYIGYNAGSNGTATVDGPGSTWTSAYGLYVGVSGTGTLAIANGGNVSAGSLTIGTAASLFSMTVGDGSLLGLGSGSASNAGTIRLKAAPSAIPGNAYTPIVANTWSGTGIVQPLGGTWDSSNHTFTPSIIATGTASQPLAIDRSQQQRFQITNPQTNSSLLANVLPSITSSSFSLTANPLTSEQSAQLKLTLPTGSPIYSAWTLTAAGYTNGDPIYLSLSLPTGLNAKQLSLYLYTGTAWSLFSPIDFNYDGTYASFTTTDLLGYAISGTFPLCGDTNLDEKVDAFDLNLLAAHWQQTNGSLWQCGDFTGDGKVDAFDLNMLATNWQVGCDFSSVGLSNFFGDTRAVPEPTTLAVLAVSAAALLRHRRRPC